MREKENWRKIKIAFLNCFKTENGEIVLDQLSKFCKENDDGFCNDERLSCYNQGRRSVILEIRKILEMEI